MKRARKTAVPSPSIEELDRRAAEATRRREEYDARQEALRSYLLRRARSVGRATVSLLAPYEDVVRAVREAKTTQEHKDALRAALRFARSLERMGDRVQRLMKRLSDRFPYRPVSVLSYLDGFSHGVSRPDLTPWDAYNEVTRSAWAKAEALSQEQQRLFFEILERRIEAMP